MRRALPWIGLLLLAACFVWLIQEPPPSSHRATAPRKPLVQAEKKPGRPDPGHGGQDSGAMWPKSRKKTLPDAALRTELLCGRRIYHRPDPG